MLVPPASNVVTINELCRLATGTHGPVLLWLAVWVVGGGLWIAVLVEASTIGIIGTYQPRASHSFPNFRHEICEAPDCHDTRDLYTDVCCFQTSFFA